MSFQDFYKIDIQGHRGCRGTMPENTIPAFIKALDIGVTTLEMDVCITHDNKVVVSHEPFMSHEICNMPDGGIIKENKERTLNIYKMSYDFLKFFDCGLKHHPRFPKQTKMSVSKPLLLEVVDSVEAYIQKHNLSKVNYNIEIKSTVEGDNQYHPEHEIFVDLVLKDVKDKRIDQRTSIQSFDIRPLQYIHDKNPEIIIAILVLEESNPKKVIEELGFYPNIYSPHFKLINNDLVAFCKNHNMKLIPWTINENKDIIKALKYGVDGIITDYPNKVKELLNEYKH